MNACLRLAPAALMLVALTACGKKAHDTVGDVSSEEAAALNNAAETLDASADGMTISPNSALDQESTSGDGETSNSGNQ